MNKETQPSRGPWTVREAYDNGEPCGYVVQDGVNAIADVPQGLADALLISAAPELIAALEAFVYQYRGNGNDDREARPEMRLARAAIAKATHVPVTAGQCPVCHHYGSDCTAHRKGTA